MAFSGQWKRYGCCPLDQDNIPAPIQNLFVPELTGYNYRTIPEWFDSKGAKLIPLQFYTDPDNLYYKWAFYKPKGDCGVYHLSTSDDIFPVIYNWVDKKRLKVERLVRHNGYTNWIVYC
jgi:hypothetical protein